MDRNVSSMLFLADFSSKTPCMRRGFELKLAKDIGFNELWLQDAIEADPELVIAPCRAAELTDEDWYYWCREISCEGGSIDIVLLSETGRIGIVETKLSTNPEGRRAVLAQLLEYAIHFPAIDISELPPLPKQLDSGSIDRDEIQNRIREQDYLLIIAGDSLDSRAVKLGQSLLGRHIVNPWDLALIETAVYQSLTTPTDYVLVPHVRGAVIAEQRQVVRVVVEGGLRRIEVEQVQPTPVNASRGPKLEEDEFVAQSEAQATPQSLRLLVSGVRDLQKKYPSVTFSFGTAAMIVRNRGGNILEIYLDQEMIRFRKDKIRRAFTKEVASSYLRELETLFPEEMKQSYPVHYDLAESNARLLLKAIENAVAAT